MRIEACEATRVHGEQSEELLDQRVACLDQRRQSVKALVDLLAHADALVVEKAVAAAQALPGLESCADTAALKSPLRPPKDLAVRARIDATRAQIAEAEALVNAGRYADGGRVAAAAITQAAAIGYRPVEARARYIAGRAAFANDDFAGARQQLIAAARLADAGRDDELVATAWAQLAMAVGRHQAHDEGLEWARYAEAHLDRLGGNARVEAQVRLALGLIYSEQGKLADAEREHLRALALQEQLHGPNHVDVATVLMQLGYDYVARGQNNDALATWQRALDIRGRLLGTEHPEYASTLVDVCNVYYFRKELDRAADCYERALAIEERIFGPDHEALTTAINNSGNVYSDRKEYARAAAAYRRAIAISERTYGPDSPHLASAVANLGDVFLEQGHTDVARQYYRRAIALREKAVGPKHRWLGGMLTSMGESYMRDGEPAKAVPWLERAVAVQEGSEGDPTWLAEARFGLGRALADSDRRRARELVGAAHDVFAAAGAPRKKEADESAAWLAGHAQ
jgi:tetratricopeptide (TPR) repeat protein